MFKISNTQELEMSDLDLILCALQNRRNALKSKIASGHGGETTKKLYDRYINLMLQVKANQIFLKE